MSSSCSVATYLPDARESAVQQFAPMPRLRGLRWYRIRGSENRDNTVARTSSLLASSATMISIAAYVCATALASASGRKRVRLNVGTTTLTLSAPAPEPSVFIGRYLFPSQLRSRADRTHACLPVFSAYSCGQVHMGQAPQRPCTAAATCRLGTSRVCKDDDPS